LPRTVPSPIADVLRLHGRCGKAAGDRIDEALGLQKAFGAVAESVYGKRTFHPFEMPRTKR
ncbi:MAG TPA: hypothetical protein VL500_03255, partial [Candidatus Eisenbacteria bacterium]|nr:hypothetical protein [Candidatus Eisenbacteria bacterium]